MRCQTVRRVLVFFLVNHICVGTRCFEQKRKLLRSVGFEIGKGTKIVGPISCTGKLIIGENCWIGKNLTIHGNGTVVVGDNCDVAPDVTFLTGGHAIGMPERRAGVGQTYMIHVENGCWIGARATIGKQVTIGSSSVVASCACVVADIPSSTLAGGVPAREIRKLNES